MEESAVAYAESTQGGLVSRRRARRSVMRGEAMYCLSGDAESACHGLVERERETSPLIVECTKAEETSSQLPGETAVAYCGGHMSTGLDV